MAAALELVRPNTTHYRESLKRSLGRRMGTHQPLCTRKLGRRAHPSGFLQQRLQGFIDGFPSAKDSRAHGTNRTLHDARNVFVTQTVEFT